MKKIQFINDYRCSPERFWETMLDAELRKRRETEGCGAVAFEVSSSEWEGDTLHSVSAVTERVNAPKPIRKIFGETSRIEERATWTRGAARAQLEFRPDIMGDRIRLSGTMTVEPTDGGHCRVTMDLEITAKVFGVGGLLEKLIAEELPGRQRKDCTWFNANLAAD